MSTRAERIASAADYISTVKVGRWYVYYAAEVSADCRVTADGAALQSSEPDTYSLWCAQTDNMTHFTDTSPFQRVRQYTTPTHGEFQVRLAGGSGRGSEIAEYYRLDGSSFIFDCAIQTGAQSPRGLHRAWLRTH